ASVAIISIWINSYDWHARSARSMGHRGISCHDCAAAGKATSCARALLDGRLNISSIAAQMRLGSTGQFRANRTHFRVLSAAPCLLSQANLGAVALREFFS